jgi:exosortase F-associated protein
MAIRGFEDTIFYDPFLSFFKSTESDKALPQFETVKLLGSMTIRFLVNTAVSLGVLWVIFQNKEAVKLSAILYSILFVVLMLAFVFLIFSEATGQHMALFYVRRFLIQPLFLLILIPAFYFQKNR